jgi:hypothetical protein
MGYRASDQTLYFSTICLFERPKAPYIKRLKQMRGMSRHTEAEVHDLRQSNESLSRRHKAKRTRLQNRGEMAIGEGRDLIDQMDLDTQVISS